MHTIQKYMYTYIIHPTQVMGELQGALQRVMAEAAGAREAAREAGVQCEAAMVKARQWEDENATVRGGVWG